MKKINLKILSDSTKISGLVKDVLNSKLDFGIPKVIFADMSEKMVIKELEDFISRYESMISSVCSSRRYYLGDEMEDCKQFIKMKMIMAYKNRHKYSDWDTVVKSIIKRKAIDFTKNRNNQRKDIKYETELINQSEEQEQTSIYDGITDSKDIYIQDDILYADIDCVLSKMRNNLEHFTERDIVLFQKIVHAFNDMKNPIKGFAKNKKVQTMILNLFDKISKLEKPRK